MAKHPLVAPLLVNMQPQIREKIGYPGQEDEVAVVLRTTSGQSGDQLPLADVKPRLNERIVLGLQQIAARQCTCRRRHRSDIQIQ